MQCLQNIIPDFTGIAHPHNKRLRKGTPDKFTLDEEQLKALRTFIDKVCSPPILTLPKPNIHYSVDTGTCPYVIGSTLFHTQQNEKRKPIGYWSHSLNTAQKNYSAPERECLAVVWAIKTLRPYLLYETFTVCTDYSALHWFINITKPSGRLTRWRLRLAEFVFQIEYKKGSHTLTPTSVLVCSLVHPPNPTTRMTSQPCMETEFPPNSDHEYAYLDEYFIEYDYDNVDRHLAAEPEKPRDLNFTQSTFEELISVQLH